MRPILLHRNDRIYALISTVAIALLIVVLIESQQRAALGARQQKLLALLPAERLAKPTGRNVLAAFQGLRPPHLRPLLHAGQPTSSRYDPIRSDEAHDPAGHSDCHATVASIRYQGASGSTL